MILREIAVESNAAAAAGVVRVPLEPGYNLIPGDSLQAVLIAGGLAGALYPDSPLEPFLGSSGSLAVSFENRSGLPQRVERDLATDTTILMATAAPGEAMQRAAGNPAEIGQRLRTEERQPGFHAFREIFLGLKQDPSMTAPGGCGEPAASQGGAPGVVPSRDLSGLASGPALDGSATEARLAALRAELAGAERAEAIEYELEGLRQELFRLEDRNRKVVEAEQRLEELERRLAALPEVSEAALGGIEDQLAQLEQQTQALDAEMDRLADQHERRKDSREVWTWGQVARDPGVAGGTSLGLFFFVMAAVIGGGARFLAIGSMIGFGVTAVSLWRLVGVQERRQADRRRNRVVEQRWKKLAVEREAIAAREQELIARMDGMDPEERQRIVDERRRVQAARDDLAGRLDTVRGSQVFRHFEQRRQELRNHQLELEGQLGSLDGLSALPSEIKREIDQLERQLASGAAPPAAAPRQDAASPDAGAASRDPAAGAGDPLLSLCKRAGADLLFGEPEAVASQILPRLGELLAAFTGGSCTDVHLAPSGACRAVNGPQGLRELSTLKPGERAALRAATRLALAEASLASFRGPFLVGSELDAASDAWLVGEQLRALAGQVQVLHVTTDTRFVPAI